MTPDRPVRMPWLQLWFSFRGRATRFDYWVRFALIEFAIVMLMAVLGFVIATVTHRGEFMFLVPITQILMIYPATAVLVKRCHDRDRSGWFLLWYAIPALLSAFASWVAPQFDLEREIQEGAEFVFGWLSVAAGVWLFIALGTRRGTIGPNRYGPDPLGS